VLYALEQEGSARLTGDEREALDAARADIEAALDAHPGLRDVVANIQDERADFEEVWAEHGLEMDAAGERGPAADVDEIDATVGASDEAIEAARSRGDGAGRADRGPRAPASQQTQTPWFRRLAAAALVVVAVGLGLFIWPRTPDQTVVEVAAGEARQIELVDGSVVRLVGETRLTYPDVSAESFDRRVTLSYGRAFFDVQSLKSEAPFIVETPTARATVVGTQFGVRTNADSTEVVLATGKVEVSSARDGQGTPVELQPGERSQVQRDQQPTEPEAVDLTSSLSWTGLLVFRGTPLERMAARLEAEYDVDIQVDSALRDEGITGTFEQGQSLDQILRTVAATLDAQVEGSEEDGYRIADGS
jgi:ferric-dicitrate binding protein FerR (iron transport regulator)